jgi:hypothetical protein
MNEVEQIETASDRVLDRIILAIALVTIVWLAMGGANG